MSNTDLLCFSKPFPIDPTIPPAADTTLLVSSSHCDPDQNQTRSETSSITPQNTTGGSSWQLSRWSRVRSIRSHRRHGFPSFGEKTQSSDPSMISTLSPSCSSTSSVGDVKVSPAGDGDVKQRMEKVNSPNGFAEVLNQGKQIYMISDGTGWTAEHSVYATLVQLQHCHGDKGCHVNTHLFSGVYDMERLLDIIRQAARDGALLLYTLVDPTMAEAAKHACHQLGVRSADVLRPTSEVIAEHLGVAREVVPHVDPDRKDKLADDFSRLIHEAVEFTLMHDDGAHTEDLSQAHIVLVGVSRSGKTPLSIYLAQKGYKVANIPIVTGMDLPRSLFEIDQGRVFGLTVSPTVLQQVRMQRAKELGFLGSTYSEMDHVRRELEHAHKLFTQNPSWPVIDVTGKAMEETASLIVRMYNDKKQKRLMPLISKRY